MIVWNRLSAKYLVFLPVRFKPTDSAENVFQADGRGARFERHFRRYHFLKRTKIVAETVSGPCPVCRP